VGSGPSLAAVFLQAPIASHRFLDALARCLGGQRQLYANTGRTYPSTVTWTLFAESLIAATGYE
jgi:hypothetical protein